MKPTLENFEELLNLACNSGGSGFGISHFTTANRCGMKALLQSKQRETDKAAGILRSTHTESTDARRMGSTYHQLHEWWADGHLDELPGFMALEFADPNFNAAMRLFEHYTLTWPKSYWGRTLKSEWLLPERPEAVQQNESLFGTLFNAKPDRVVYITDDDLKHIDRVHLTEPGVYVIDFKTSGMDHDPRYWSESLQAMWYPWAVKYERPDWEVRGTIHDVIRKPRSKKDAPYYEAHFEPISETALLKLRAFVDMGQVSIAGAKGAGRGNVAECVTTSFGGDKVCSFHGTECAMTRKSA